MATPQNSQPRQNDRPPLPPGNTPLVTMYPLYLDSSNNPHPRRPTPAHSRPDTLNGGK